MDVMHWRASLSNITGGVGGIAVMIHLSLVVTLLPLPILPLVGDLVQVEHAV